MKVPYLVISFLLLLLLGLRFFFYYTSLPSFHNGQTVAIIGIVQNQPKMQGDSQKLTIVSQGNTFFITTKQEPSYWYAEKLSVHGNIRTYASGQRALLSLSYPEIVIDTQQNQLAKFSEYIRERVSKTYTFSLDNDMKGLLIGMLFFNPGWVFDIGFQLSFVATVGLFFIKPLIDRFLSRWIKTDNILLADLSTTTAVQIATLPILMANFGY